MWGSCRGTGHYWAILPGRSLPVCQNPRTPIRRAQRNAQKSFVFLRVSKLPNTSLLLTLSAHAAPTSLPRPALSTLSHPAVGFRWRSSSINFQPHSDRRSQSTSGTKSYSCSGSGTMGSSVRRSSYFHCRESRLMAFDFTPLLGPTSNSHVPFGQAVGLDIVLKYPIERTTKAAGHLFSPIRARID